MTSLFGKRDDAKRKPYEPLRRSEAVLTAAAQRRAKAETTSKSRPSTAVQRVPRAGETVALAAAEAWNDRAAIAGKAVSSSLRFLEFVRAYMAAFAAGFATYLLLMELSSGHINIFAAIGMHLVAIITAPFYALALSPAIFSLYGLVRAVPAEEETRIYLLGLTPGALVLLGLAMGRHRASPEMILMALIFIVSGLVAARTFNRSAAKIRAARDAVAT